MAGRYEATQGQFGALMPQLRQRAAASGSHRRTPEIVANLAGGFGLFLTFAASVGAIGVAEHAGLAERCGRARGAPPGAEAPPTPPSAPPRRFLELLRGALSSGRAHVAAPDSSV